MLKKWSRVGTGRHRELREIAVWSLKKEDGSWKLELGSAIGGWRLRCWWVCVHGSWKIGSGSGSESMEPVTPSVLRKHGGGIYIYIYI